ncbi:MAG TPA: aminoacetone oxidase family FAD-binding enzyme [Cytophagales bacterium]|jgi:predicted Rossmann fold flavoprotein|nr:aminoacetone oxidase family FAD-binding enzyme [Cytophagales bacterium]
MMYDIIVIGGGAAGIFFAANFHERSPQARVLILEKSNQLLSKVRISGGGRCNVTNSVFKSYELVNRYPRGGKKIKPLLDLFGCDSTIRWFEKRGVELKIEEDGRVFPKSDQSSTIINCLLHAIQSPHVVVRKKQAVEKVQKSTSGFEVNTKAESYKGRNIFWATGGHPKISGYAALKQLGLKIDPPVPSLFTFNIPDSTLKNLQGIAVENTMIRIAGTKLTEKGPTLITHWGLSGPAVLRLSAWGARELASLDYNFDILINWLGDMDEDAVRRNLKQYGQSHPKKKVISHALFNLPKRLWGRFCELSLKNLEKTWLELSKKELNKLTDLLINMKFEVRGKTTFKEEFVTCGGIALNEVDLKTMECQKIPGLYFGGEVINIDGITGGFNFQSAWATAYLAAKSVKM